MLRSLPGWGVLTVSYTLIGVGYIVFASYLVAVLEDEAGFTSGHAALVYSLFGATSLVGGIVCGHVSDRVGRRAALVGTNVLLAAAVMLVLTRTRSCCRRSAPPRACRRPWQSRHQRGRKPAGARQRLVQRGGDQQGHGGARP